MKKRIKGLIFLTMLLTLVLAGCGKKEGRKEENKKEAKGRYIEEMVSLPGKDGERGISLIQKKEGGWKVYTYCSEEKKYYAYESEDGKEFHKEDAGWLNGIAGGEEYYLKDVFEGEDGKEYLLYYKSEKLHLIRKGEGEKTEEILPEVFESALGIEMAAVDENGNIITSDTSKGELKVYSAKDGSCLKSMEQGTSETTDIKMFDCAGARAAALKKDGRGFAVYDLETGETVQEIEYKNMGDSYGVIKLGREEEGLFYLDRHGLHHVSQKGTEVETMLDGELASMGDLSVKIEGFEIGKDKDYFALYSQEGGGAFLAHYVYDKNAKASADSQFTIYGLKENKTIRQAAARFQKKHPEIRVNYRTGSQDETGTTRTDQIRVLNTELLSGNGADVLVLDGLPVSSYVEKGVLEDMTDFYEEISKKNPLLENITESMKRDKKLYAMPVRAKVLGTFGSEAEIKAMESLDSLSAYLDGAEKEGLLNASCYEKYLKLLMNMNYKELFQGSGKKEISEKELKRLLKITKKLGEKMGAEQYTVMEFYMKRMGTESGEEIQEALGEEVLGTLSTNNELSVREGKQAVVVEAGGIMDLIVPCAVLKEMKMAPKGIHNLYLPRGMVGVNSGSKNKKLAEEFLEMLFSQEIQSLDLGDGFPVSEEALESWCTKEKPADGGMSLGTSDEDGNRFDASEPGGEEVKPFAEIEREADTPILMDEAVVEVITDESIPYFKGENSLEKAVQNITNKIQTYLAE